MAFLDTSALITELWSDHLERSAFIEERKKHAPNIYSTLVKREFDSLVTNAVVLLHSSLVIGLTESQILQEISSNASLRRFGAQLMAAIKRRTGGGWNSELVKLYLQSLIEGGLRKEVHAITSKMTDVTKCEVARRTIEKSEMGFYSFQAGCNKKKCKCSSPLLFERHVNKASVDLLKVSDNRDVSDMGNLLDKFISGDKSVVQGRACGVVADLAHYLEAKEEKQVNLLTSDKSFEHLERIFGGIEVRRIEIGPILTPKGQPRKLEWLRTLFNRGNKSDN